ncbi:hypothetical protein [Cellulosimicrobium sp. TH-20]|nr:hypothetical protein [Cellulosimicrobium sp. TH-20]
MTETNTTAPPPPTGPEAFLFVYAALVLGSLTLLWLVPVGP